MGSDDTNTNKIRKVKNLAIIMVTSLFPSNKAGDGQQIYRNIQDKYPLPSFIKQKQGGMRWVNAGIKGVAFYEVEKGNIEEALNFIYQYEGEFAGIEGFSDEIEVLLTMEEFTGEIS